MATSTLLNEIPYAAADAYREGRIDDLYFLLDQWSDKTIKDHQGVYGDTVYMRHTYNGLIALDSGDIEAAKKELLMAGYAPKSGVLASFGPNMMLAKRLLEAGEQETVLRFLDFCKRFWFFPFRFIWGRKWKSAIQAGEVPNFGMHLTFFMERPSTKQSDRE